MTSEPALVGIIANPASGKDIRRLVAYATTVDTQGKVNIVRRILIGLGAIGVPEVLVMPDTHSLGEQALDGLSHADLPLPAVNIMDMPVTGRPEDSSRAAALLREQRARCIIVLGGDGTVRMASKGAEQVPLLAVSTGTNNVLPSCTEGTIAGLAAGGIALERIPLGTVGVRHKWLEVLVNGAPCDLALVDVAVLAGRVVGSRAVWDVEDLKQVVVTRADPATIGISAIAAVVRPTSVTEPVGVALSLGGGGRRILAAVGPGLLAEVGIAELRTIEPGEMVVVAPGRPLVLALDGEREIVLHEGDEASLVLHTDGPWILDPHRVVEAMVAGGMFERGAAPLTN
jgi:predicted polyphosphate/ATP-dependent NAD kinase